MVFSFFNALGFSILRLVLGLLFEFFLFLLFDWPDLGGSIRVSFLYHCLPSLSFGIAAQG
ncbi:MAG: hypothetical protein E6K96_05665 [Thaumarchaeota archaeon]|nr:MAG: hypothetical protein E6K96_05665 [Nitrososphaerota archaeon]